MKRSIRLKKLTKKQCLIADKVVKLLIELENQGVHPIIIDGGGGDGLSFVRCPNEDMWDFGFAITEEGSDVRTEVTEEFVYSPENTFNATVSVFVP